MSIGNYDFFFLGGMFPTESVIISEMCIGRRFMIMIRWSNTSLAVPQHHASTEPSKTESQLDRSRSEATGSGRFLLPKPVEQFQTFQGTYWGNKSLIQVQTADFLSGLGLNCKQKNLQFANLQLLMS